MFNSNTRIRNVGVSGIHDTPVAKADANDRLAIALSVSVAMHACALLSLVIPITKPEVSHNTALSVSIRGAKTTSDKDDDRMTKGIETGKFSETITADKGERTPAPTAKESEPEAKTRKETGTDEATGFPDTFPYLPGDPLIITGTAVLSIDDVGKVSDILIENSNIPDMKERLSSVFSSMTITDKDIISNARMRIDIHVSADGISMQGDMRRSGR